MKVKDPIYFFKKYWLVSLGILVISVFIFLSQLKFDNNKNSKIQNEYPVILNHSSVNGIILKKIKVERGSGLRVQLYNGDKKSIGWASNDLYNPTELSDFMKINDSISKKSGSDTLFVYRTNKTYIFILSKRLNEENP